MVSLYMKTDRLPEDIKARLDIVDIISDYVELRKSGRHFKGLCPFHSEKTPSFMVNPDKQIFHCFGCGTGGDAITFVMRHENFSFPEALKVLAKKAGINLAEQGGGRSGGDLRQKLIDLHDISAKVFTEGLRTSKKAVEYLLDRGVSEEAIKAFSLGYAREGWHYLSGYLRKKGFSEALILQSGLASSGDKGIYDTFRGRIIFPIYDLHDNVIAFGGRVMDNSQPKYLNSPETPLFRKWETLYGLNHARDEIRKKGSALIVEGYLDVISCHQRGFCNAVAPLGTALTAGHLERLKRFTKKIIVVFDGDAAGKAAAGRSLPLLLGHGFITRVLLLPEGDDPDSFLKKTGAGPLHSMLGSAKTPVEFAIGISAKDTTETVHDLLEMIAAAKDAIMREELVRELSKRTGMRETVLREKLRETEKKSYARLNKLNGSSPGVSACGNKFAYDEETLLLSALLAFPERSSGVLQTLPVEEFKNALVRRMLEKLCAAGSGTDDFQASLSEEEEKLFRRLTFAPGFDIEHVDRNLDDCIRKILMRRFDRQVKEAEISGNLKLLNNLLMDRQDFLRRKEVK